MLPGIGIDTGGTFTDAVLLDMETGLVLASSKALTTRRDLAIGIREALHMVLPADPATVRLVSLSTTLATNALVEGNGAPVCALLIGYGQAERSGVDLAATLGTDRYAFVTGGHDGDGREMAPLDEAAAEAAIRAHAAHVRAFAVSGYFGTRNPAHERTVRHLVTRLTGLPTTAGHELTQQLDAMRRATTATLNARLIPLIAELIGAVQVVLDAAGISAPLMLVKGDGSLMQATVARDRPIETILSGPAASVVGARHLCRTADAVVVDMGGTTTDIALVENGQPLLSASGARVCKWHTMVHAMDIQTVGLGGDSHVQLTPEGNLTIGPRRVLPLCMLSAHHDRVCAELALLGRDAQSAPDEVEFLTLQRAPTPEPGDASAIHGLLLRLQQGPLSRRQVDAVLQFPALYQRTLRQLERQGILIWSGVTPTDALHALGRYTEWDAEASRLALAVMGRSLGMAPGALAARIVSGTSQRIAQQVALKLWDQDGDGHASASALSAAALDRLLAPEENARLRFVPVTARTVAALGAPAGAYLPEVARLLNAGLDQPALGHVANAVGAVVGGVVARSEATIVPGEGEEAFLVRSPEGTVAYDTMEEALAGGRDAAERGARGMAESQGADDVRTSLHETESTAPAGHGYGGRVFVSMRIEAQAIGRPRLGPPGTG
jgi:N-methylhydantoinase A/oxoprolinase/acetone carboxylase beta subunit